MGRHRKQHTPAQPITHDPRPPLVLELFLIPFSAVCLILACIYMSQVKHAPTWSNLPYVSWSSAGSGSAYFVPPGVTFIFSCFNMWAYRTIAMPLLYSLIYACIMCAGWITTIAWWFQCHINLWEIEDRFCYQLSLRSGSGKQEFRNVDDSLLNASLAFAILILILYIVYVAVAGIDLHHWQKARRSGTRTGYVNGYTGSNGGTGAYTIGLVYLPWSGDGSGCGGGSGGGGDGGGGGGGDGGGGGC
ncbi:hypothetical protein FB567DRAFT_517289 [Paraphoma chrysanthemicola]|uniref:Uncharacterized protein n=1 Tax=Paraphoma chrysanthemicola TaxID=798071 RepID=A0A8K0W3H5_9PLEO|nr:hypothetical protein FB567DRAFT_517289 [Paraphoma chrysanthemicola]